MAKTIRAGRFRLLRRAVCDCAARDLFRRLNASIPAAGGGPLARREPQEQYIAELGIAADAKSDSGCSLRVQ